MKNNIIRNGSAYMLSNHSEIMEKLPVGTYSVMLSQQGYFLERGPDLELGTTKVYGDVLERRDRILYTFLDRPGNTGVILSGSKGSGKTLLARAIAEKAAKEMGMPIILVNQPHSGDAFNAFIQSLDQECIVLFDEFEKMYAAHGHNNPQADLLSLFDGVAGARKRLYIVTLNDVWGLNQLMLNRPGRFYYHYSYKGLSSEFIRQYVEENLKNQANADSVYIFASAFSDFNFDILKALVEEMNRYDLAAREVVGVLNADPSFDAGQMYEISSHEFLPDADIGSIVKVEKAEIYHDEPKNVLKETVCVSVEGLNKHGDEENYYVYLKPEHVVAIEPSGAVRYVSKDMKATLTKVKNKRWSMSDMM